MRAFLSVERYLWILFILLAGGLSGCQKEDPFAARAKELQYTIEDLATELTPRLQNVKRAQSEKSGGRTDEKSRQVAEQEAVRGGDGERPDPNSLEAIAADTATKLRTISEKENRAASLKELIDKLTKQAELPQFDFCSFLGVLKNWSW